MNETLIRKILMKHCLVSNEQIEKIDDESYIINEHDLDVDHIVGAYNNYNFIFDCGMLVTKVDIVKIDSYNLDWGYTYEH